MKDTKKINIEDFARMRNVEKPLFTPGPASLLAENLTGLRPCFGRGDQDYKKVESEVLGHLRVMSGHEHVVPIQGSASLALELMAHNFLYGKVLVISSGYYSDRLEAIASIAKDASGYVESIDYVDWRNISKIEGSYDWIVSCSTETSKGLKLPIEQISIEAGRLGSKLMLDATASIGMETGHYLADVIGYSSCKGLFGLTGAAFVAFNEMPNNKVNSFYLDLRSHLEKKMTGPYHAICSLLDVLPVHSEFKEAVKNNKSLFCEKMHDYLVQDEIHQPLICTYITETFQASNDSVVLYKSRGNTEGQVVSHLGEVYLGSNAKGEILNNLYLDKK
jgi:aspartate aminotransferase-like enzyme